MARTLSTESKQITTIARTREILIRIPLGGAPEVLAERERVATSGGAPVGGSERGRTLIPPIERLLAWKEFPAISNAIADFLDAYEAEVEADDAAAAASAAAQDNG